MLRIKAFELIKNCSFFQQMVYIGNYRGALLNTLKRIVKTLWVRERKDTSRDEILVRVVGVVEGGSKLFLGGNLVLWAVVAATNRL